MSTERLYYTDAYLTAFDARVVACRPLATPGAFKVELDRTAFYPTSGGQPFDTGTLAGVRVLDVLDEDDGRVAHVTDAPLAKFALQLLPQLIPDGDEVTVPAPFPAFVTLSVKLFGLETPAPRFTASSAP